MIWFPTKASLKLGKFDILGCIFNGPGRDIGCPSRDTQNRAIIAIFLKYCTGPKHRPGQD